MWGNRENDAEGGTGGTNITAADNGDEIETVIEDDSGNEEEVKQLEVTNDVDTATGPYEPAEQKTQPFISAESCEFVNGSWVCSPYKIELLERELFRNSPGSERRTAVIETLRTIGVKVFVIDANSTQNAQDVVEHIRRVVAYVARENSFEPRTGPLGFQRCLLYQDESGRLFNLMLSSHVAGPSDNWRKYLDTFSGREAMIALTVLCRSIPCVTTEELIQNLKPAYLTLILGLVLTEEISLSWLNASMMVRATPSVSAHALTSPFGSDSLRKIVLLMLALAGATKGLLQSILTIGGVIGACVILLANLGARSWHFLGWKPMTYNSGPGSFVLAYILAILTGFALPYMGHRSISVGGKGAMEYVLKTALLVAVIFVISDYDDIQKFIVVGSQYCNQDAVNLGVGCWWMITLILSLILVRRIPYNDQKPDQGERVLVEDHASPVGYKVPSLPDFEIDSSRANDGSKCLHINVEFALGLIMAGVVGAWLISLSFTKWDENFYDYIDEGIDGVN